MDKKTKKTILICLASLMLGIISCIALFFTWQADRNTEFNSETWKNKELARGKEFVRKKMVYDLLKDDRLLGKTSAEIDELLGPGTRGRELGCDTRYYLGPSSGFDVSSLYLCINFDSNSSHVVAAKTVAESW